MIILIINGIRMSGLGCRQFSLDIYNYVKDIHQTDFVVYDLKTNIDYNKYDLCIITTVPKKTDGKKFINGFLDTLEKLECKKVFLEVSHQISFRKCFYYKEEYRDNFLKNIDLIINHIDYGRYKEFLDESNYKGILKKSLMVTTDYDKLREQIPVSKKEDNLVMWIGRPVVYKGIYKSIDFCKNYLLKNNYVCTHFGVDNGKRMFDLMYKGGEYGWKKGWHELDVPLQKQHIPHDFLKLNIDKDSKQVIDMNNTNQVQLLGKYTRETIIPYLSKCKFGLFLSYIPREEGPIENTFNEFICSGTVPIVLKEWFEEVQINGLFLKDYNPEDIGLIILDVNKQQECLNKMNELRNNEELYNQYVINGYNFFKGVLDTSVIGKHLIDVILETLYK